MNVLDIETGFVFSVENRIENGKPVIDIMITAVVNGTTGGTSYSMIGIPADTAHKMAVELNRAALFGVSNFIKVDISKRVGL